MSETRSAKIDFIRTEHLRYSYRKNNPQWVLSGIDLSISSKDYLLIAGASGSGKSTLCRTFNGLIPHFYGGRLEGIVAVDGTDVGKLSVAKLFGRIGMVFQNAESQLFNRTVETEIAFGLESLGIPRTEMKKRIAAVTHDLGIFHLLQRAPHTLSGGEQQLVCLASVFALRPKMIVLDEPYANLDPAHVDRVREALRRIHAQDTGVIVCEHRMRYTAPDADRMFLIDNGILVADGKPHDVLTPDAVDAFGLGGGTKEDVFSYRFAQCQSAPPRNQTALSVEKISHETARGGLLRNVSFSLAQGESLAVVGANGAGKTTLLKHLNGLLRPTEGRVLVRGKDIKKQKVSRLAREVGMAFQNPSGQFFKLTVKDEILAGPLAVNALDPDWIDRTVKLFRLGSLLDRAPYRLSGGEKKRVGFASALAARPAVLLLDEPTAGQDGHFRRDLGRFLSELQSNGQSVIFATHDLVFAAENAHRWIVMAEGRVIADAPPRQVMMDRALMAEAGLIEEKGGRRHV